MLCQQLEVVRAARGRPEPWQDKLTFHPAVQPYGAYAMASIFSGGLAFDWIRCLLFSESAADYKLLNETLQAYHKRHGPSPVLFLPYLTGSGSPSFDGLDRAAFWGLSPDSNAAELAASVLEGVCYCVRENIELLDPAGHAAIVLAGGGSRLAIWGQLLCEVLNRPVDLLARRDASVWGAVLLASQFALDTDSFVQTECTLLPNRTFASAYQNRFAAYLTLKTALNHAVHQLTENQL